ncbi:MAG: PIN domain-containing protein [Deltaproteobacteria bacterium]|nr:PIN domain-containing protein [Deltaproteobacteria bacterium]
MIAYYVDSSVLVGILFREAGWKRQQRRLTDADRVVSAALTEAEIYATVTREQQPFALATEILESVALCIPERSLRPEYSEIFACGYCRGADACHLATALYLDPDRSELVFLTNDQPQRRLAVRLGLAVA